MISKNFVSNQLPKALWLIKAEKGFQTFVAREGSLNAKLQCNAEQCWPMLKYAEERWSILSDALQLIVILINAL